MAARDGMPSMENTPLPELRKLLEEGGGAFPALPPVERAEARSVPGPAGDVPIRIIRPDSAPRRLPRHPWRRLGHRQRAHERPSEPRARGGARDRDRERRLPPRPRAPLSGPAGRLRSSRPLARRELGERVRERAAVDRRRVGRRPPRGRDPPEDARPARLHRLRRGEPGLWRLRPHDDSEPASRRGARGGA